MSETTQFPNGSGQTAEPPQVSGNAAYPMPIAVKVFLGIWACLLMSVVVDVAAAADQIAEWEWIVLLIGHGANLTMVLLIAARKSWARRVLMALVIIGLLMAVPSFPGAFQDDAGQALLGLATHVVALISFAYLYRADASDWFKANRHAPSA